MHTATEPLVGDIGELDGNMSLRIGPRFLELFSEQLYSSPNKAFEELVANAWDAGATAVYIGVSDNLTAPDATIWVLDNGASMDFNGLKALWNVAVSMKREQPVSARPQIGRFGIGKLATYLLAHQITYICRARDGAIRGVTLDYRRIDQSSGILDADDDIQLAVRRLSLEDVRALVGPLDQGHTMMDLVKDGVRKQAADPDGEFADSHQPDDEGQLQAGTWTLVVLTELKDSGQDIQSGRFRRMLRAALPLGSSISITLNGELLDSTKVDVGVAKEWLLGESDLSFSDFECDGRTVTITSSVLPYPHISIDGIGDVTGRIKYYRDRISGGKSDALGASNGFFVNVLGRVINLDDPSFGIENLSHGVWAKIRVTLRADGLDKQLRVNREDLLDGSVLRTFRAFLLKLFNILRTLENEGTVNAFPTPGDVLRSSWATIPLLPLRRVVKDSLEDLSNAPTFIDATGCDVQTEKQHWDNLAEDAEPAAVISEVGFETISEEAPLFKFRLSDRHLVVNEGHPFCQDHTGTREERDLLLALAFVDLLTESYMIDNGIDAAVQREIRQWRDQAYRLTAQISRQSAPQIASLLIATATTSAKGFELAVGEALRYLGFSIKPLGQPGEPEGVATAPLPATDDGPTKYVFTYDAKSSKHGRVKTSNVGVAGLSRHRGKYDADYVLVVAPSYEVGAPFGKGKGYQSGRAKGNQGNHRGTRLGAGARGWGSGSGSVLGAAAGPPSGGWRAGVVI